MFNVVLVEPEIPPNTGNVGRLCLATIRLCTWSSLLGSRSMIAPETGWTRLLGRGRPSLLGFVRRAAGRTESGGALFLPNDKVRSTLPPSSVPARRFSYFWPGDPRAFRKLLLRAHSQDLLTIPMHGTRSLNLATAVAIVLFEAVRQVDRLGGR